MPTVRVKEREKRRREGTRDVFLKIICEKESVTLEREFLKKTALAAEIIKKNFKTLRIFGNSFL